MILLHIDSAITGDHSTSRTLTRSIVTALTAADPLLEVTYRDLSTDPLAHLDLAALPGDATPAAIKSEAVIREFLDADVVVIGAPMYNFSVPSVLKAWIDRIVVAGRTFTYDGEKFVGLTTGKRVIVAVARGNFYGTGTDNAALEHVESYLSSLFGFIGVNAEFIVAEGLKISHEHSDAALARAQQEIERLAVSA